MIRCVYKSRNNARSPFNWPLNRSFLSGLGPLVLGPLLFISSMPLLVLESNCCMSEKGFIQYCCKGRQAHRRPRTVFRLPIAFHLFCSTWFVQRELWWLTIIAQHHSSPAKFVSWLAVTWLGRASVSQPSGILMWICTSLCKKQQIKNNWCNILNWTGNVSEAPGIFVSLLPRYSPIPTPVIRASFF